MPDLHYGNEHYKIFGGGVAEVEVYKGQNPNEQFVYLCNGRACSGDFKYCGSDSPCKHTSNPEYALYKDLNVTLYFSELGPGKYMEIDTEQFLREMRFVK